MMTEKDGWHIYDDPCDATWHEADPPPQPAPVSWRRPALCFGLSAAIILAAVAAFAQSPCAPREGVVAQLESKYGETRRGSGLTSGGSMLEVWASVETGTWTVLMTTPDGTTCGVAEGHSWERDKAKPGRPM